MAQIAWDTYDQPSERSLWLTNKEPLPGRAYIIEALAVIEPLPTRAYIIEVLVIIEPLPARAYIRGPSDYRAPSS